MGDHLGVLVATIGAILAHSPSTPMGIAAVYDQSQRIEERRQGLEARGSALLGGKL